jgi:hypothetical protein
MMDDQLHRMFSSMVDEMHDPPAWDDLALQRARNPGPKRTSRAIVAMAAGVVAVVVGITAPLLFARVGQGTGGLFGGADNTPTTAGGAFSGPEYAKLVYEQELTLTCDGLELFDEGGFDSFTIEVWVDPVAEWARLGFRYPDGSTYDLILEGRFGDWRRGWSRGADAGRYAGCRDASSIADAGWAHQWSSPTWFEDFLSPVSREDAGITVVIEGMPTAAQQIGENTYVYETVSPSGNTRIRFEFALDGTGERIAGQRRHRDVSGEWEASATIDVVSSGPVLLPVGIFDTSEFTPLWGLDGVSPVTTSTSP